MSSLAKQMSFAIILSLALLALAGCSSPNGQTGFDSTTGKHIQTWYVDHRAAFLNNQNICTPCHGTDLRGGIAGISCFSTDFNGLACHANGPSGHPAGWADPSAHGASAKAAPNPVTTSGFSTCQLCHGTDFSGGYANKSCFTCHNASSPTSTPPHAYPWIPGSTYAHATTDPGNALTCALCHLAGRATPSYVPLPNGTTANCFDNSLCHGAVAHSNTWYLPSSHGAHAKSGPDAASQSGFSICQTCHGMNFQGGAANQSCFLCHTTAPHAPAPWTGSTATNYTHINTNVANGTVCASCHLSSGTSSTATCFNGMLCHATPSPCKYCHTSPPSGSSTPNIAGAHTAHYATSITLPDGCNTCHTGGGIGTPNHMNGTVMVSFLSTYNSKSTVGSYSPSAFTCTNVSCHGGQTTPSWRTGTINVNTQCTSCHSSGTSQYNSYNSGQHNLHVIDHGFACVDCHDTSKLAVAHFNDLNTTSMLQAAQTITSVYNTTGKYCTFTCHLQGANLQHDSGMTW